MPKVIDYSESFPVALVAQGKDRNVLILYRLDKPFRRADGKRALYQLDYRWLSTECQHKEDEAWCCVQGSEFTFWQRKEIQKVLSKLDKGEVDLFEHFNLF